MSDEVAWTPTKTDFEKVKEENNTKFDRVKFPNLCHEIFSGVYLIFSQWSLASG